MCVGGREKDRRGEPRPGGSFITNVLVMVIKPSSGLARMRFLWISETPFSCPKKYSNVVANPF